MALVVVLLLRVLLDWIHRCMVKVKVSLKDKSIVYSLVSLENCFSFLKRGCVYVLHAVIIIEEDTYQIVIFEMILFNFFYSLSTTTFSTCSNTCNNQREKITRFFISSCLMEWFTAVDCRCVAVDFIGLGWIEEDALSRDSPICDCNTSRK